MNLLWVLGFEHSLKSSQVARILRPNSSRIQIGGVFTVSRLLKSYTEDVTEVMKIGVY